MRAAVAVSAMALGVSFSAFRAPRAEASASASFAPPAAALSPSEFRPLKVTRVEQLTHDTRILTFALPEGAELGGTTASCVMVKTVVDGKDLVRPYTPTSPAHARGSVSLIVKTYPDGKASK